MVTTPEIMVILSSTALRETFRGGIMTRTTASMRRKRIGSLRIAGREIGTDMVVTTSVASLAALHTKQRWATKTMEAVVTIVRDIRARVTMAIATIIERSEYLMAKLFVLSA
jgi:hypothetical protein